VNREKILICHPFCANYRYLNTAVLPSWAPS